MCEGIPDMQDVPRDKACQDVLGATSCWCVPMHSRVCQCVLGNARGCQGNTREHQVKMHGNKRIRECAI